MFRAGSLVGWYSGKTVPLGTVGDYVMDAEHVGFAVDGAHSGTILRFINGTSKTGVANMRFGSHGTHYNRSNRIMIPIYATRHIRAHDELLAYYGRDYRFSVEQCVRD